MSAAARAEARRKAILSRGGDRLAKLTTSARGDEAPFMNEPTGIRSTSSNFIGEDSSDMPAPKPFIDSSATPSPQPTRSTLPPRAPSSTASSRTAFENGPAPDPTAWSPEQQRQFMQALMGASAVGGGQMPAELQTPIAGMGDASDPIDPTLPPLDNPLAAMLFPQGFPGAQPGRGTSPFGGPMGAGPGDPGMGDMGLGPLGALMNMSSGMGGPPTPEAPAVPPSRLQKFLPLLHLVATWSLLAYFVLFFEPRAYAETSGFVESTSQWGRWGRLLGGGLTGNAAVTRLFKVQLVPFFWAFLTLQVTLHSMRIFTKNDNVQPPALLALALPHIPPPFPSIIINSLKYIRMISALLDDIAILVVGLGLVIYLGSLFSAS